MLAGLMDKYIKLEVETTAKNPIGTPVETYILLRYTYASIKYTRGGTDFDEAAHPFTYTEYSIRWMSDINYKCRILFDSEYYKILHIEKIGRKDGLRLKCVLWDE